MCLFSKLFQILFFIHVSGCNFRKLWLSQQNAPLHRFAQGLAEGCLHLELMASSIMHHCHSVHFHVLWWRWFSLPLCCLTLNGSPDRAASKKLFSNNIRQHGGEKWDIDRNNKRQAQIKEWEVPFTYLFIYLFIGVWDSPLTFNIYCMFTGLNKKDCLLALGR